MQRCAQEASGCPVHGHRSLPALLRCRLNMLVQLLVGSLLMHTLYYAASRFSINQIII
jgi:hypothetical protein